MRQLTMYDACQVMAKNWKENGTPAWILYIPTSLRVGYNNNLLNVKTKIWADKIFTRR